MKSRNFQTLPTQNLGIFIQAKLAPILTVHRKGLSDGAVCWQCYFSALGRWRFLLKKFSMYNNNVLIGTSFELKMPTNKLCVVHSKVLCNIRLSKQKSSTMEIFNHNTNPLAQVNIRGASKKNQKWARSSKSRPFGFNQHNDCKFSLVTKRTYLCFDCFPSPRALLNIKALKMNDINIVYITH